MRVTACAGAWSRRELLRDHLADCSFILRRGKTLATCIWHFHPLPRANTTAATQQFRLPFTKNFA